MREAVKVIIVDKEIGFRIPQRFTVVLQTSREFINEPERIISYEEKKESFLMRRKWNIFLNK